MIPLHLPLQPRILAGDVASLQARDCSAAHTLLCLNDVKETGAALPPSLCLAPCTPALAACILHPAACASSSPVPHSDRSSSDSSPRLGQQPVGRKGDDVIPVPGRRAKAEQTSQVDECARTRISERTVIVWPTKAGCLAGEGILEQGNDKRSDVHA